MVKPGHMVCMAEIATDSDDAQDEMWSKKLERSSVMVAAASMVHRPAFLMFCSAMAEDNAPVAFGSDLTRDLTNEVHSGGSSGAWGGDTAALTAAARARSAILAFMVACEVGDVVVLVGCRVVRAADIKKGTRANAVLSALYSKVNLQTME